MTHGTPDHQDQQEPAPDGLMPCPQCGALIPWACYGRTVAGTPCELPAGHYPNTQHRITMGTSWMSWTDEAMADFARIADDLDPGALDT